MIMNSCKDKIIEVSDENILEFVSGGKHDSISTAACVAGGIGAAAAMVMGAASGIYFLKAVDGSLPSKTEKSGKDTPKIGDNNKPITNGKIVTDESVSNYGKFVKYGKIALGFLGAAGVCFSVAALADV